MAGGRLAFVTLAITTVFSNCGGGGGSSSVPSVAAPTPVPLVAHPAFASDSYVDSIGINTHYSQANYPQASYGTINTLLIGSGIRHVRDSAFAVNVRPDVCSNDVTLGNAGLRFDFITSLGMTAADINAWNACVGPIATEFEPYNEYDLTHPSSDPNWPATAQSFQQTLYSTIKGNAATSNVLVLAPSLTTQSAEQMVGSLTSVLDSGNVHGYFAGFQPETGGFGAGGYGSLSYNLANARIVSGPKPIEVTETDYATSPTITNDVDYATQAKYLPRSLFYQLANGVTRTYLYELVDEPGAQPQTFADAGIVDVNYAPKPAYGVMKNMIGLLADPGASFAPTPLTFGLGGNTADVQTVVLEKRTHEYDVAIWIGEQSYDPNAKKSTGVASRQLTYVSPTIPNSATLFTFDPATGNMASNGLATGRNIPVTVSDSVAILRLTLP